MANKVIMSIAVGAGDLIEAALAITAKRGRGRHQHPSLDGSVAVSMSGMDLTSWRSRWSVSRSARPTPEPTFPDRGLYADGQLKLDELVTCTYRLDEINDGYEDMREGRNLRGVINIRGFR